MTFQTPATHRMDRKDHVWFLVSAGRWKCCLCGAITAAPPAYRTPAEWRADRFEKLTEHERTLSPAPRGD